MSRSSFKTGTGMNKKSRRAAGILAVLLAFVFVLGSTPTCVWADDGGFTTESFNVTIDTDEDHVFHIYEEITVDFSAPRHGIYRYIPDGEKYYSVKNIRVDGYRYDVYSEKGNQVVQIGDADYTVMGVQTYRIRYDIVGFLDDDDSKDMLSIDLLPTGWTTPIQSADLTLNLPKAVDGLKFYSGGYGDSSDNYRQYFDVDVKGGSIHAQSRTVLPKGVGLTVSADLPEGYWVDPASREDDLPAMYGGVGVMGMLMLLLWLFVGRDDPVIKTVEFYPPEEMDPLEVAYVANDDVANKDLSALFMYFANRGYAKISSTDQKHFSITRIRDIDLSEPIHARQVFSSLFSESDTVYLDDLPSSFGETAASIRKDVIGSLDSRKINFSPVSRMGRAIGLVFCLGIPVVAGFCHAFLSFMGFGMIVGAVCGLVIMISMMSTVAKTDMFRSKKRPVPIAFGFIMILAAIAFEGFVLSDYPLLALVFVVSTLAAVVATIFVKRRMNNEIYGKVLGFRDFIKTAEYDRLKMLSDEDPEYYFNILPYAYVFGMSTKWADKFANFKIPQPSWYDGAYPYDPYFGHHIFVYTGNGLNSAVSNYYHEVGSNMLSDAFDSGTGGGGGFGGGGFSGGGFGGGGGGSW